MHEHDGPRSCSCLISHYDIKNLNPTEMDAALSDKTKADLCVVVLAWYRAAQHLLLSTGARQLSEVRSKWSQSGGDYLHRYPSIHFRWSVDAVLASMAIAEWHAVEHAFDSMPIAEGQWKGFIRLGSSGRALRPLDLADLLLAASDPAESQAQAAAEALVCERVNKVVDLLNNSDFNHKVMTPIFGIDLDQDRYLGEGVSLVRVTHEMCCDFLEDGRLNPGPIAPDGFFVSMGPKVALVQMRAVRKIIGHTAENPDNFADYSSKIAASVLHALVITLPCRLRIGISKAWIDHTDWFLGASKAFLDQPSFPGINDVSITGDIWTSIVDVWHVLRRVSVPKQLDIAIGRLLQSSSRQSDQDRLLDLMIAAEAVLLKGISIEMSFRMALNAAIWLADVDGFEKEQVFKDVSRASRVRNVMVHGDAPSSDEIASALEKIEKIVRACIQKIVLKESCKVPGPEDWQAMLLGEATEHKATPNAVVANG